MKTLVEDYSFNKDNRQVIFLSRDYPKTLEEILLVTNVSTGDIIYNFADKLRGGVLSANVLTLNFDTSTMSNTDRIQIFIESDAYHSEVINMMTALLRTVNFARDGGDRMRMIMDNSPMVCTYMRNSATPMAGSTEPWYSVGSFNAVDAREQLMAISNGALSTGMQRWVRS